MRTFVCCWFSPCCQRPTFSQTSTTGNPLAPEIDRLAQELTPQVVAWRRDFHEHPELGNRETRTAKVIADELRKLGFEVKTDVAHTGVVGVLRGGKATSTSPVVALRSDMDALAGHRAGRPAVQVQAEGGVERTAGGRHARLRPRQPHGDPAGHRHGAVEAARSAAGNREGDFPACRRRSAARRAGRRRADDQGGRARQSQGRRGVRTARVSVPGRHDHLSIGPAHGKRRHAF